MLSRLSRLISVDISEVPFSTESVRIETSLSTTAPRKALLFLVILFAVLLFLDAPGSWLFDPDEARYAEIPHHMIASGDFLTPQLNGSNYFEKPPLLYWANALSFKVLGETPFAARLPTRLAAMGIALLLIRFLSGFSSGTNLWAAVVYLSSFLPFALGRINLTDGLVSFGLTLALLSAGDILLNDTQQASSATRRFQVWLGIALAVMAKGLIGLVIPGLVLIMWVGLMGERKRIAEIVFSKGAVFFIAAVIPWFFLMEVRHPGFLEIFFVREHVLRYFTDGANRPGSFFYFVPVAFLGLMPWTLFLVPSVRSLFIGRLNGIRRHPNEVFLWIWFIVVFFFFTLSRSKLIPYLLPAFPAAAALIGISVARNSPNSRVLYWTGITWIIIVLLGIVVGMRGGFIDRYALRPQVLLIVLTTISGIAVGIFRSRKNNWEGPAWMAFGWAGCYVILISIVPIIATDYSQHGLAAAAGKVQADEVVSFRSFPHGFPLVLKRPIPVVDYQGELASDGLLSPELFWSQDQFWPLWNSERRIVVVFRKNEKEIFDGQPKTPFYLARNRRFLLAANFQAAKHGLRSIDPSNGS